MSSTLNLKAGMWVQLTAFKQSPEWNGMVGYLKEPVDSEHWAVHFPGMANACNTGDYSIHLNHIAPFTVSKCSMPLGDGSWVQAQVDCTPGTGIVKGMAGRVVGCVDTRIAVWWPVLDTPEVRAIYAVNRKAMRVIVPAGPRIARKKSLNVETDTLDFMKVKPASTLSSPGSLSTSSTMSSLSPRNLFKRIRFGSRSRRTAAVSPKSK